MSIKIREWLKALGLFDRTTHEDRFEIDREIERRTGVNCDQAVTENRITKEEFQEIVHLVLKKKKKTLEMPIVA